MVEFAPDWAHHSTDEEPDTPLARHIELTPASKIRPRRVRWLWDKRIAYGTLALLAGREGLGKSTLAYHLAAAISQGTLDGEDHDNPRSILVCATEDSWAHTIVPRLIAAGADLDRVYRVEVVTYDDLRLGISLPRDLSEVTDVAAESNAGLMILDPLMSVIDARLDTHRDREVRQAIEPLSTLADQIRMAILGLIHHNKSSSTDALQLVMGSKAFAAVARSVHTCIPDPDDDTQVRKLFATSKNNLGRTDLPVLGFTIASAAVDTDDDGTAWTGRLNWTGEVAGSMHEIMTRAADPERNATTEAADWLTDYLTSAGGEAAKVDIEKAAKAAGHTQPVLRRARERLRLAHRSTGFPRRTWWSLPGTTTDEPDTDNPAEPRHEPPPRDLLSGVSSSHDADTHDWSSRASHDTSGHDCDTTGADLHKHQNDPSRARAHAQGESPRRHDWGNDTTAASTYRDSRVSRVSRDTPHARDTTGTHQPSPNGIEPDLFDPPHCPDCGYPVDTNGHTINCEEAAP